MKQQEDAFLNCSNDEIVRMLSDRKAALESLIKERRETVGNAPEGHLQIMDKKKYVEYYWRKDPKETNGVFIPKKNWGIAKSLAQKDYDSKVIGMAETELKKLNSYLNFLKVKDISSVYKRLNSSRKALIVPYRPTDEEFVRFWKDQKYEPMGFMDGLPEYYSGNGTRVRSKSEIIIADMLEKFGVPYKYEAPLRLERKGLVRPDFTCLNVRTRKEFIWEHLGMMDDADYANKNVVKINTYEENGFHIGENLLLTFETSLYPINSAVVKTMIKRNLL